MKKRVGKVDTQTILLVGAGAAALYFLTRPKALPAGYNPATGLPYSTQQTALNYLNPSGGSNLAQDISAGGAAAGGLATLVTAVGHLF